MSKLDKKQVYAIVLSIQNHLANIPSINAGGCGRFAAYVGEECKRRGIDFKLKIIHGESERSYNKIETCYKTLSRKRNGEKVFESELYNLSFAHCFVEIDGFAFDSDCIGEENICEEMGFNYEVVGEYSLEDMQITVEHGCWNFMYSTSNNPELEHGIKSGFSDILDDTRYAI